MAVQALLEAAKAEHFSSAALSLWSSSPENIGAPSVLESLILAAEEQQVIDPYPQGSWSNQTAKK